MVPFQKGFKISQVIPIYIKDEQYDKSNYRPIDILSNVSKIHERCIHDKINAYFDDNLSIFQCSFRKGYSAQHRLLYMIEKIRKNRDSKGVFVAVLTDLSKAFDCILHELLFAKLHVYGFDKISLTFIYAYLSQLKQKTKLEIMSILYGALQGSILGLLLVIIYTSKLSILKDLWSLEAMQIIPLSLFMEKILTKYLVNQEKI